MIPAPASFEDVAVAFRSVVESIVAESSAVTDTLPPAAIVDVPAAGGAPVLSV